jgi:hypothetical protein
MGTDPVSLELKREAKCDKCRYFLLVDNDEMNTHFCRRHSFRIYYGHALPCEVVHVDTERGLE